MGSEEQLQAKAVLEMAWEVPDGLSGEARRARNKQEHFFSHGVMGRGGQLMVSSPLGFLAEPRVAQSCANSWAFFARGSRRLWQGNWNEHNVPC